jgi:hypothetical protein
MRRTGKLTNSQTRQSFPVTVHYNDSGWRAKAMRATEGTRFGIMLLSALGLEPEHPPSCGRPCVTSDGFLIGNYVSEDGESHMGALLGAVADLETNIVAFPRAVGMTLADRKEFYATWRKWIATDYRSPPGLRLDDGRTP